jgi:hypothetical protein
VQGAEPGVGSERSFDVIRLRDRPFEEIANRELGTGLAQCPAARVDELRDIERHVVRLTAFEMHNLTGHEGRAVGGDQLVDQRAEVALGLHPPGHRPDRVARLDDVVAGDGRVGWRSRRLVGERAAGRTQNDAGPCNEQEGGQEHEEPPRPVGAGRGSDQAENGSGGRPELRMLGNGDGSCASHGQILSNGCSLLHSTTNVRSRQLEIEQVFVLEWPACYRPQEHEFDPR